MIYCSNCGRENPEDARFCDGCGYQIHENLLQEGTTHPKSSAQPSVSSSLPQQTMNAQSQQPSQPILNQYGSATNAGTVYCTECGAINTDKAGICTKCGNSLSVEYQSTIPKSTKEPVFAPGTPLWGKILSIIIVILMFGSGGILLLNGAFYGTGSPGFLTFFDDIFFGAIFLVTFAIYKFADRLPRSVRKKIRKDLQGVRLDQIQYRKIPAASQFCSACGAPRVDGLFCESCGAKFE